MIYVFNDRTDPYFNLAAEEYLLRYFQKDLFMLWQNEPSVIVGKHQDTGAEINTDFIQKNKIRVIRRMSGGGAVYHDLGNLNFSFIEKYETGNYQKFNKKVQEFLIGLGIDVGFDKRNNMEINGLKISGSAQHVGHGKILHHGTLLISSILSDLNSALNSESTNLNDRFVKSVRSPVTNISNYLPQKIDILTFKQLLAHYLTEGKENSVYHFNHTDIQIIEKLKTEKYMSEDWNFGNPLKKHSLSSVVLK